MIDTPNSSTSASMEDAENNENDTIEEANKGSVEHHTYSTNETEPKARALLAVIELHNPKSALILCNEASEAEFLARFLMHYGFSTEFAHDELGTTGITNAFTKCVKGALELFICPHHLAEQQESAKIDIIVNYDLPARPENYAHLAKERAGAARTIISLIGSKDFSALASIRSQCLVEFNEHKLPLAEQVQNLSAKRLINKLKTQADAVELGQFENLAKKMLEEQNITAAVALLLRNYLLKPCSPRSEQPRERREREPYGASRDRPRREREARPEREPRKSEDTIAPESTKPSEPDTDNGVIRLYVSLGRQDDFHDLADLAHFLSEGSGVDLGHFLGTGMIRDHSAHIEVDADVADKVIAAMHNQKKPGVDADSTDPQSVIICEQARQNPPRSNFRKGPPQRRGSYQRR